MKLSECTLNVESSLRDALLQLNKNPTTLTVFLLNKKKQLVGTLTDGDVRRGLINGLTLADKLEKFMQTQFSFLIEDESNFSKIKKFRDNRLKAVPMVNGNGELLKIYDFSLLKSILPVDAVIMAGGKGLRLRPLTENTPKPLLKIGAKEIISYNFDRLHKYGIQSQHLTINYLGDQIRSFCINYNEEIKFNFIEESRFLGTAGALSLINEFKNDTILLMNSDLLTDLDYEDYYKSFLQKDLDILVASIPYNVKLPYAIFETHDGQIKSLKEKPNYTYYANAGIYMFKKEVVDLIPHNTVFNATDLLEIAIKNNLKLEHYPIRSYWLDIGNHDDFEKAQKDIAHIDFD